MVPAGAFGEFFLYAGLLVSVAFLGLFCLAAIAWFIGSMLKDPVCFVLGVITIGMVIALITGW